MSAENLAKWYARSDSFDRAEGLLAYTRYNKIMRDLAEIYDTTVERAAAVFVSLSPNNEYGSNLRSAVTVLDAIKRGIPEHEINTSTYNHCRARAYAYGTGALDFETKTKGLKVLSFYRNLIDPTDPNHVTVDGHVNAAYHDQLWTMKEALIGGTKKYYEIRDAVTIMANAEGVVPNAVQAVIWFTRKRVLRIKYDPQIDMLIPMDDQGRTFRDVRAIKPYELARPVPKKQRVVDYGQQYLLGI